MRRAVLVLALLALLPGTAAAKTSNACKAAAAQARTQLPDYSSLRPYSDIGQALCFDFTGDGRRDLVVTRWEAMNHGAHYWAAFRHGRAGYTQILGLHDCCRRGRKFGTGIALRRLGRDLVVSQPVYKPSDPLCCPTGGDRVGRWSYRNHRLELVSTDITR